MFRKYLPYIIVFLSQLILFLVVMHDPFSGDSIISSSRVALDICRHHLFSVFYPADIDPGHPTLYPWLLALIWTVFGKTLFISHLFSAAWMIALTLVLIRIARRYLDENETSLMMLFVVSFSTYLSLSAMMLNTTALMLFFFISVYGLLGKKQGWLLAGNILMVITHLEGTFFLLAIALADYYISFREERTPFYIFLKRRFIFYLMPFLIFCGWLFIHHNHSGWYFNTPNFSDTEELNNWKIILKSLGLILWRLLDYGMFPFHFLAVYAIIKKQAEKNLAAIYLITMGVTALLTAVFLEHTIGHRYFFPFHLLAMLISVRLISGYSEKPKILIIILLVICLVAGNFLYYPGKNLGDATLAYRNYFRIEERIRKDFGDHFPFYGFGPLANPVEARWLQDEGLNISRIESDSVDDLEAVLQSNLNASFSPELKSKLSSTWYGKTYEEGPVYVNVFLNPACYKKPPDWKLREPGKMEKWILKLKQDLK